MIDKLMFSIKNLIKWFKIIWNDRHYSSDFLLLIIKFKLELDLHYNILKRDRQNDYRKICINLIDNIISERYSYYGDTERFMFQSLSSYRRIKKLNPFVDDDMLCNLIAEYRTVKANNLLCKCLQRVI